MAKKVSKNSRAARNGLAQEPEAKALEQLPRASKTDLTNILIRTTAKNEALLEAKLHRKTKSKAGKISKKDSTLASNLLSKERVERALNFTSRLDGKIAKSINRAKYVQSSRKAGWDSTNEKIRKELSILNKADSAAEGRKNSESEEDDMQDSDMPETETQEAQVSSETKPKNLFSVLTDDVEV